MSFEEITPSEFFYRNRDLAGFTNPTRSLYFTVRELVENSLDSCESKGIKPELFVSIAIDGSEQQEEPRFYDVMVQDNGGGIPRRHLADAFGRVFYGSKFKLKQSRGMFGLGVTMAVLYGQATTNRPAFVASSVSGQRYYGYQLKIDVEKNRPVILRKFEGRAVGWRGTLVAVTVLGDYQRAESKIISYLEQTAMAAPYVTMIFRGPRGEDLRFHRVTDFMPKPPHEILPHPLGVDIEMLKKMIRAWKDRGDLAHFLTRSFQRVGGKTVQKLLERIDIPGSMEPGKLSEDQLQGLMSAIKSYEYFLPPDPSGLSPLGADLLEAGVRRMLNPEFLTISVRKPSAYGGHPFTVEVAVAYGGPRLKPGITVFRLANRIPLLYDESSDVTWKVLNNMDLSGYRIRSEHPIGVIVHICSTRVPYKTVGKEYIADRPEIEREIRLALRDAFRRLRVYLSRKETMAYRKKRASTYSKYLPLIAKFAAGLVGAKKPPPYEDLIPTLEREVLLVEEAA